MSLPNFMASEDPNVRSSSGSRSSTTRSTRQSQPQQLSTIEKSVTHLLVATKQLLETLTQWSRNAATEAEVSDVYVRLGYEFNIACRAFNSIGVDTNDLGPVPDLLRGILEETLSQEATQQSLDRFLPRIRDIIINLLHGLKKKQQRLRSTQRTSSGSGSGSGGHTSRQTSVAESITEDALINRHSGSRSHSQQRQGSSELSANKHVPPRSTSVQEGRSSPRKQSLGPNGTGSLHRAREASRDTLSDTSSMSSNAMQNIPVIAPYPQEDTMPAQSPAKYASDLSSFPQPHPQGSPQPPYTEHNLPPPPPPPKQQDALAALQRGGELERRASRRFSAYQISKHLGSTNGVPMIPSAQNTPIPNRGRDTRESMKAVRTRSIYQSRQRAGQPPVQDSPKRERPDERRISELTEASTAHPDDESPALESAYMKTPEDKLGAYPFPDNVPTSPDKMSATINGPLPDPMVEHTPEPTVHDELQRRKSRIQRDSESPESPLSHEKQHSTSQPQYFSESSPQPGEKLTLFLQYKTKIKKFVLPDGGDLSIARLQLAFIEKFAWNTHSNGNDLPEIYLQDPASGVRHELEDLSDIKDRSVLVLNVEQLDEVKKHFDDGLGGIKTMIEGLKAAVDDQHSALQRVSDRQQEAAKEMASLAVAPAPTPTRAAVPQPLHTTSTGKPVNAQLDEVQSLRRDLAVVRQTYTTFVDDINTSMSAIRTKATSVKTIAEKARIPSMPADSGRVYVNTGKKSLSDDSEKLVTRVDDLQDTVEDLRKDVVTRGVRPLPRQLDSVGKDISTATTNLKRLQDFLKKEKPIWTKIWEKELQVVCDDRDLLTMQEELCIDLEDDLEKAAATFALVEQATRQQNLQSAPRASSNNLKPIALDRGGDPLKAHGGVLGEVKALQPNHESRLEAIERAEKNRQIELESRRDGEFQKELSSFVGEGKLKKSGGVEEAERLRKIKDERGRKDAWEVKEARAREREEKKKAALAARAAEAESAEAGNAEPVEEAEADVVEDGKEEDTEAVPEDPADEIPKEEGIGDGDEVEMETPTEETKEDVEEDVEKETGTGLEPPSEDTDFGAPSPAVEFVDAKEDPPTPAAE